MSIQTKPFSLAGLACLYTAPSCGEQRDTAVLFASAYGYEDLCSRKMLRVMADGLANLGIASLRLDYIGTGDSLDEAHVDGRADWAADLAKAASSLRKNSGAKRLIVVAQGMGSLVAAKAIQDGLVVDGIAHLAPVMSGKSYLRELSMWAAVIDDGLGLRAEDRRRETGHIAGMSMPATMVEFLTTAKLSDFTLPAATPVFIACRSDRSTQSAYGEELRAGGADVQSVDFAGYDALMQSPTEAKLPHALLRQLITWLDEQCSGRSMLQVQPVDLPNGHESGTFHEEAVAFGATQSLIGTLTMPSDGTAKAVVVLNGSGYDRRCGWARQVTYLSRQLADHGIASLRFDAAGTGDSAPTKGAPDAVLYHDSQLDDVTAAIDFVAARESGPIVLCGRCSGAYWSLRAAAVDARVASLVAINPVVFYWQKGRSIDDALDMRPRTLREYKARVFSRSLIKRLLRGEINLSAALTNVVKSFWQKYNSRRERYRRLNGEDGQSTFAMFDQIAARNLPLYLTYSADDAGLVNFSQYFASFDEAKRRYGHMHIGLIKNADHNLSADHARDAYLQLVLEAVDAAQK
jgi:alpha-beta hydrolase superfamily lysophospholipase